MSTIIEATFDGTVFRPLAPVSLEPNTVVRLAFERIGQDPGQPGSFLETAFSLDLDGPPDWASNPDKYLYGPEGGRED